jgi:hypothetical protein
MTVQATTETGYREAAYRAARAAKRAGKTIKEVHAAAVKAALEAVGAADPPQGPFIPAHHVNAPHPDYDTVQRDAHEIAGWVLRGTTGGVVRALPDEVIGPLPSVGPGPWRPGWATKPT